MSDATISMLLVTLMVECGIVIRYLIPRLLGLGS